MEKIFTSFAELAASAIAERWRVIQGGHRPEVEPVERSVQPVAAVELSLEDRVEETSAHVSLTYEAE